MKFARAGGLSPVKYGKNKAFSDFHAPPERRGIFAFIWPHVEPFLFAWNPSAVESVERKGLTKFSYDGLLYAHIGNGSKRVGAWNLIHTDDLIKALARCNHLDAKFEYKISRSYGMKFRPKLKAYTQGFSVCKDHLEVFIPARFLGKVR